MIEGLKSMLDERRAALEAALAELNTLNELAGELDRRILGLISSPGLHKSAETAAAVAQTVGPQAFQGDGALFDAHRRAAGPEVVPRGGLVKATRRRRPRQGTHPQLRELRRPLYELVLTSVQEQNDLGRAPTGRELYSILAGTIGRGRRNVMYPTLNSLLVRGLLVRHGVRGGRIEWGITEGGRHYAAKLAMAPMRRIASGLTPQDPSLALSHISILPREQRVEPEYSADNEMDKEG